MIRYAIAVLTLVPLACDSASAEPKQGIPRQPPGPALHGWMARDANPKHAWLYVAGSHSNNVLIYDLARVGTPQIGSITTGISAPQGLFIDEFGTLYVANGGGSVTVYAAGTTVPSLTITQGITSAISATPDSAENVWVTNRSNPPSILIYPAGQTAPAQTITGDLIRSPAQIAFDLRGNAYFSDNLTGVSEIPVGTTQPVSLGLKEFPNQVNGLALDPRSGTLFVSFGFSTNKVNVYASGHKRPERTLSAPAADFLMLGERAGHGRRRDLFVAGALANTVTVFREGGSVPFASFSVATQYTEGVALKPAGVP